MSLYNYLDFSDYLDYIGSKSCPREELEDLHEQTVDISLNGHNIYIPFSAEVYKALVSLVEAAIKEL